jgi:hypothetical protein
LVDLAVLFINLTREGIGIALDFRDVVLEVVNILVCTEFGFGCIVLIDTFITEDPIAVGAEVLERF